MGSHQGVDDVKMMNRGLEFIGNLANPTDIIQ